MVIATPNLDDRRFQDLVDDAKRMVMERCPTWTDHNVSDPGVTLIETFAWMTDQLLFRLNRVPDRLYAKFLDLIGIHLFQATAARAPLTFWMSAPPLSTLVIPRGTRASTRATSPDEPVVFSTLDDLTILPTALAALATRHHDDTRTQLQTENLRVGAAIPAFGDVPAPGDVLLVGLDVAAPANAIALRFDCEIDGVGVDPRRPPLRWEAWTDDGWRECEVDTDETGGLNRDGDIILHLPAGHTTSVVEEQRAGWLRAVVTPTEAGQSSYELSPLIRGLAALTVGGSTPAAHVEISDVEVVGESNGLAGQRFRIPSGPLASCDRRPVVELSSENGWTPWAVVESFADCGPSSCAVVLDAAAGEIELPPIVRLEDGSLRAYGQVPAAGTVVRIREHAVGGGALGNVRPHTLTVLRSSIPFVRGVTNRQPACDGVDAETMDQARVRGPLMLRTRGRAVTREDFELLTREAAPEVARVRAIAATSAADAGAVTVCVVPSVARDGKLVHLEDLLPSEETLAAIATRLDACRVIGTTVSVEPPRYQGITVVTRVRADVRADADRVRDDVESALYRYFDPLVGGPDGGGWPWGRAVHVGDAFAVVQQVPGVAVVEEVLLFSANPVNGKRSSERTDRVELAPNTLAFSYEHKVKVVS